MVEKCKSCNLNKGRKLLLYFYVSNMPGWPILHMLLRDQACQGERIHAVQLLVRTPPSSPEFARRLSNRGGDFIRSRHSSTIIAASGCSAVTAVGWIFRCHKGGGLAVHNLCDVFPGAVLSARCCRASTFYAIEIRLLYVLHFTGPEAVDYWETWNKRERVLFNFQYCTLVAGLASAAAAACCEVRHIIVEKETKAGDLTTNFGRSPWFRMDAWLCCSPFCRPNIELWFKKTIWMRKESMARTKIKIFEAFWNRNAAVAF